MHLVRNSLRYVPHKDMKAVSGDFKSIYRAVTLDQAESPYFYLVKRIPNILSLKSFINLLNKMQVLQNLLLRLCALSAIIFAAMIHFASLNF